MGTKEDDEQELVFKIIEGKMHASDYANFCLIVPESDAGFLLTALQEAKSALSKHNNSWLTINRPRFGHQFQWCISDDEITDVTHIPPSMGHLIRSIREEDLPKDKSESELLDWLVHGESYFSKKYVAMLVQSRRKFSSLQFEINKQEHLLPFIKACKVFGDSCDCSDVVGIEVLDRGEFLYEYSNRGNPIVVDDRQMKALEEDAISGFKLWVEENEFLSWN